MAAAGKVDCTGRLLQSFQQGKETDRFEGYFRRRAHRLDVGEDIWYRARQKKDEF